MIHLLADVQTDDIGINNTIIGGIVIEEYALIGAGSVVAKDINNHEIWYGSPAKFKGYVCLCGNKCDTSLVCDKCR